MAKQDLTSARVRELFNYNPHTGSLTWKVKPTKVGTDGIAGCWTYEGYRQVQVDGAQYRMHRVIWLYVTGDWPSKHIDHINGDKGDNRFINLRDVDNWTNRQNVQGAYKSNKSTGLLGVYYEADRKKFRAQIVANGKKVRLGRFNTAEEAHAAYLEHKRQLHGGCTI